MELKKIRKFGNKFIGNIKIKVIIKEIEEIYDLNRTEKNEEYLEIMLIEIDINNDMCYIFSYSKSLSYF